MSTGKSLAVRKFARVAIHEYKRNVFKRSFLLALLSVPLIIALNVGVGFYLESRGNDDAPVGYVDRAGLLANPVPVPVSGSREPLEFVPFQTQEAVRAALESGEIQAFFVVAADYGETRDMTLFYLKEPGGNTTRQVYDFVQANLLADRPPEIIRRAALISEGVTVRSLDGRRELPSEGPSFGIIMPLLLGFAFLFLFLMNAGYLMQAVVEEKENRTMEVLVTSVSPGQLIGGKVLGVVAIGLTQLTAWVAFGVLAVVVGASTGIEWFQDLTLDWELILTTVAIAIPAYVCTAALMTAIGATTTSTQESQATGSIFFILHVVPLYLAWLIVETPNAVLPTVFTFLPFTALLTLILRSIFASVPLWQVAVAVALQVLYAAAALWLAGRAFRMGMLQYGQRLNWRKLVKARSS
jgi:ABC-2 type transport system permease protein